MRIEEAAADGDQIGLEQRVAHQHHGAAPAKPLQQIGELALEVESAGHHEVGPSEPVGIPWRWLVGVGIDAGGHQAIDGHPVSPHLTHEIGHHGCGGHHPQRATVRCPWRLAAAAAGHQEGEPAGGGDDPAGRLGRRQ